jgi:AraC-like DNA-binding protein
MLTIRDEMIVRSELEKLGIHYANVALGEVILQQPCSPETQRDIQTSLKKWGFEIADCKKSILVEKIKQIGIEFIHHSNKDLEETFSDYLSRKLKHNYTYLSNVFSEVQGKTIEQFMISCRIERAKELIAYDEMALSEIAYDLRYSSAAHLSNQFKKVTGQTPTSFKQLGGNNRIAVENL